MSANRFLSQRARWAGGQPISYLMQKALAHPELISLAAGFVDQETLPVDPTRQALEALLTDPVHARAALQYGTTPGYFPLREAVLRQLIEADGKVAVEQNLTPDNVILTAGSNQMLHLLADTLFDPGDVVLCAAPTYFVYLLLLQNLGVRSIGVESDEQGIIPGAVEEALRRIDAAGELARVKAIYVVSYYDNPSCATLSLERRPQIVELAKRWSRASKIHVIEDAAYRELRLDGADVPSLRAFDREGDTVAYTHTFSKSFSPGIRVGWGILPKGLVEPVLSQKGSLDFGSPNFSQHLMAAVLKRGLFEQQLGRLRDAYRTKRDAMVAAADEHLRRIPGVHWRSPQGGLYVWLELPSEIEAGLNGKLFDTAIEEGVIYTPGEFCYPSEGVATARNRIRLSYGVQTPERIRAGIAALGRAIERVLSSAARKQDSAVPVKQAAG
jgi:2-aminoadipate transaminase